MEKIKYLILVLMLLSAGGYAQTVKVINVEEITNLTDGEFYYPKLSLDGSKIFFTSANFTGLWYYDMNSKKINKLVSELGAGYEFTFSNDGKSVYYRTSEYNERGLRTSQSIYKIGIDNGKKEIIQSSKSLSTPQVLTDGKVVYTANDKLVEKIIDSKLNKIQLRNDSYVCIENQKIAFYQNGNKKILDPLNAENYIWPSLSPDKSKLLFTAAGKGSYISNLDGAILVNLGKANAPKWSSDGKWISYMVDNDNGEVVTSSDIFLASVDGKFKYQLTNTSSIFEMYPEWSSDSQSLVYHSNDGKIYIMKLKVD
ncbi:MAG: hypothetical protein NTX22_03095 [Ignavibacteriales bacterium]|nr:hypothetical protein [Ignavibacteriales bacterium]